MFKKKSILFISVLFISISFSSFAKMSSDEATVATYLLLPDPQFCYGAEDDNFCARNNVSVLRAIKTIQQHVKIDNAIVMGDLGMGNVWDEEECFLAGYVNSLNAASVVKKYFSGEKTFSVDDHIIANLENAKISSDINVFYLRGNHDKDDWMNDFHEDNGDNCRSWDMGSLEFVLYDDVSISDTIFPSLKQELEDCAKNQKKLVVLSHNINVSSWPSEKSDQFETVLSSKSSEEKELKEYMYCMIGAHQHQLNGSQPAPEKLDSYCGKTETQHFVRTLLTGGICTEKTFVLLRVIQNKNDKSCRLEFLSLIAVDHEGAIAKFECGLDGKGGNNVIQIAGKAYEDWGWEELNPYFDKDGKKI